MQTGVNRPAHRTTASGAWPFFTTAYATAKSFALRQMAYTIEVVRWPLWPIMYFITLSITYRVSGRTTVDGMDPEGFLLVGTLGMVLWSATIWTGGYAIEWERTEGTILSLFLTPASRTGVVLGYLLGSLIVFILPSFAIVTVLAVALGAEFQVSDPLAVFVSATMLALGAVALGYFLSGAFVLTRRANMFANFVQSPVYLLSGMAVPVSALPEAMQWFAFIFPISAAMMALRETLLAGSGFEDIQGAMFRFALFSLAFFAAGVYLLRRVEHVAKRGDQLDFD